MNRTQKEAAVARFKDALAQAPASFLVEYKGATVAALEAFRAKLRDKSAQFKITKARLMKIAAQDIPGGADFSQGFSQQQIGLVFASDDVSGAAKEVVEFAKENEGAIKVLSGFYSEKVLSKEEVEFFAKLPPREVLLGQVAGTLQAPIVSLARLLNMLIVRLLYVLQRIAEKKEAAA